MSNIVSWKHRSAVAIAVAQELAKSHGRDRETIAKGLVAYYDEACQQTEPGHGDIVESVLLVEQALVAALDECAFYNAEQDALIWLDSAGEWVWYRSLDDLHLAGYTEMASRWREKVEGPITETSRVMVAPDFRIFWRRREGGLEELIVHRVASDNDSPEYESRVATHQQLGAAARKLFETVDFVRVTVNSLRH